MITLERLIGTDELNHLSKDLKTQIILLFANSMHTDNEKARIIQVLIDTYKEGQTSN